jgi:hypothetical protein
MGRMKALFHPVRVATVALSTFVFMSGCETTSGVPELTNDPQPAPREARTAQARTPSRVEVPADPAAAPAEEVRTAPRCNPAPVPGVKPKPYCDY